MHESCSGICIHKHFYTELYFLVILACKRFHHYTHRPNHVISDMRSANTLSCRAFKKIGIILAPYELSCILINRVIYIYVTQIRHSEQTWHICIIHQQMVAETINLECIYIAVFWMIVYGMFFQGFFHFIS